MGLKNLDGCRHCSGEIEVIRIQPADEFTMRPMEAFIDRFRLTGILFGDPPGQAIGVTADDLDTAIGGSPIYNQILNPGIILFEHREAA